MHFDTILSGELFGSYKPDPKGELGKLAERRSDSIRLTVGW
jgi:hypothetical protein